MKIYTQFSIAIQIALQILLMITHLYFTIHLKGIQSKIVDGIRLSMKSSSNRKGGISPYEALSTTLAATIGTGNIIGISTAIALGGVGSIFWCWVTGVLGMATCYAECFLSAKYRIKSPGGNYIGGPMYVLEKVLNKKKLAIIFAGFTIVASFGIGSGVQSHSITGVIKSQLNIRPHIVGIAISVLAGFVLIGGTKTIAKVCSFLVPCMSLLYIGGCLYIIVMNIAYIPKALMVIVKAAFSEGSVIGGVAGTAVTIGMRVGIAKGLFTNEAGMGSMAIAAAESDSGSPHEQGLISMTSVFWDTVVMCAITGIAIVSSMISDVHRYKGVTSDKLCFTAFSQIPFGEMILTISLVLFAFATIIGWSYYGKRAAEYIGGSGCAEIYMTFYVVTIFCGAIMSLEQVWKLADILNIFMTFPNIISLWFLRDKIN